MSELEAKLKFDKTNVLKYEEGEIPMYRHDHLKYSMATTAQLEQ